MAKKYCRNFEFFNPLCRAHERYTDHRRMCDSKDPNVTFRVKMLAQLALVAEVTPLGEVAVGT